jgi:hypothetical protein
MDYRRKSKKGRITIVRTQSSGNLVGRYLDWHSKESVKTNKQIAKIQQERIRKYGDLGRLDKFFFDDLTLGQLK